MRRFAAYLPAALWALLVLRVGSQPYLQAPPSPIPLDKVAHFGMYGVMGGLAAWGWRRSGRRHAVALVVAPLLLVGLADEMHQATVPGRTPDVRDWAADATGILAGFGLLAGLGVSWDKRG